MDRKSTQPDQDNHRAKVKFVTNDRYEAPLFRNACDYQHNGIMYGTDGKIRKEKINMNTQYTKNTKGLFDDEDMDPNFDSMYFPGFTTPDTLENNHVLMGEIRPEYTRDNKKERDYDNDDLTSNEKSRFINHGSYIPGGSMEHGGFGTLDNFSRLKYGDATRNTHSTIMDTEVDRFHYTFRNYQHEHYGSNPDPENSRRHNKSFN